jgi:nitrate/TMAO reductase-like tetraheme cytochrome c subunit
VKREPQREPGERTRRRALPRVVAGVVAVAVLALAVAVGVAVAATSDAGFVNRYHELQRRYTTLQSSTHRGIACGTCHESRAGVAGLAARVNDYYGSLTGTPTLPTFNAFAPPSNEACLACHRYDWSDDASRTASVPHPAHLRTDTETRPCVSCHKWTAHEEPYQLRHKTMPFSVVCASFACHVGTKQQADCVNCHHVLQETKGDWRVNHPAAVRASGPNACLETCHKSAQCEECHTTGSSTTLPSSIATASSTAIETLHVKSGWLSEHGTIALQDPVKCTTCHISEGECQDCHAIRPPFHDPASTWLVRHKDVAKDTRRCLTCHEQPWCDACHAQFKAMS